MKVIVYTLPECPWCYRAKRLLEAKGLEYEEKRGKHPDHPTVPYIIIDDEAVGGFSELSRLSPQLRPNAS